MKIYTIEEYGPAIEYSDGRFIWCINGIELTEEEFNKHPLVIEHRIKSLLTES